jgi:predicted MFS family arabinose efflux permease
MYGLSIGMFTLILNLHLLDMGVSEKQIGLITSMGILVMGIFAIPVSILAKKTGRKKLLVSGVGCLALGCSMFALAKSFILFFLAQWIVSIGLTLVETTETQLLFYYSRSKREETQAYSFMFAVFTAFTGVGTLLGGFLPHWIDLSGRGYQNTLLVTSVIFVLLACVRGWLLPAEKQEAPLQEARPMEQKDPLLTKPRLTQNLKQKVLLFSLFAFLTGGAIACLQPYLNLFVKLRFGFSSESVSIILALNGLALFIGSIMSPILINRWGIKRTFFSIYLVNIIFCFILYLNIPAVLFSTLLVVRGGMFTMLTNLADSLSMSSFKDEERDLYAGMRAVFRSVGSALVAFIIGGILATNNYTLPFLLAGLMLLIGYIYFAYVLRAKYLESEQEYQINGQDELPNEC